MYAGSCLCGQVQIQVDGAINSIIHCHCSLCRKSSGTAYSTNGFVETSAFSIERGSHLLASFEYRPGKRRFFCSACGSPIFSRSDDDESRLRIRLGILDTDISERPSAHTFFTSRANWEDPNVDLPRFAAYEPERHAQSESDCAMCKSPLSDGCIG